MAQSSLSIPPFVFEISDPFGEMIDFFYSARPLLDALYSSCVDWPPSKISAKDENSCFCGDYKCQKVDLKEAPGGMKI